jgi:hypothetical protein
MKITYTDVSPIIEAVKQGGRVVAVAIVPLLITQLNNNSIDWKTILVTGAVALLMSIDKYLHLDGKINGNDVEKGGLVRF